MFSGIKKSALACWKPIYARLKKDDHSDDDEAGSSAGDWFPGGHARLLWSRDLEKHFLGELSFAVIQANQVLEDYGHVETGREATFVGVYDGHGGHAAAEYTSNHLFLHLMEIARGTRAISEDAIRGAFAATENGFLTYVSTERETRPEIGTSGSCCLVGVIWRETLYVANLGDSRAVIGSLTRRDRIVAEQLNKEHNASMEEVREELRSLHPDDSTIVVKKHGAWRVKGIIQVSRSIGDGYLKRPELALGPSFPRFHLSEPLRRPALSAEPAVYARVLKPNDQFLIFASDGLWEYLSNQEAVEIVHKNPRRGIAKRLIKEAFKSLLRKLPITPQQLMSADRGARRQYHDDITVVVVFLDHELLKQTNVSPIPELSLRAFVDTAGPSGFNIFQGAT